MKAFIAMALAASLSLPVFAATPSPRMQAKLDKALAGRVAGEPVKCINLRDIQSTEVIDGTAIIYRTIGGGLYVNRPDAGTTFLRSGYTLVTDTRSPQLCDIDVVRLVDVTVGMPAGSVNLGAFVPYKKVDPAK